MGCTSFNLLPLKFTDLDGFDVVFVLKGSLVNVKRFEIG